MANFGVPSTGTTAMSFVKHLLPEASGSATDKVVVIKIKVSQRKRKFTKLWSIGANEIEPMLTSAIKSQ